MSHVAEAVQKTGTTPPEQVFSGVVCIPETSGDVWSRKKAEKIIEMAGTAAVHSAVELVFGEENEEIGQPVNLMEAIHRAADGDEIAEKMVDANVGKDISERNFKVGNITKVKLKADKHGKLHQHGQPMDNVYMNGIMYASATPHMRLRACAEARNGSRIEDKNREGLLKDHYLLVMSLAPKKNDKWLGDNHFFADTKTVTFQATTVQGDGLVTESAFVSGVKALGEERHDYQTAIALARRFGVDYEGLSDEEILDRPLLIPKYLIPNGVIDIVKLYDEHAGGTFFGEAKPQQDYLAYATACEAREKEFEPMVKKIKGHLLAEAPVITSPLAAIKRLDELSHMYSLENAFEDKNINPRVFGSEAAIYIEQARRFNEQGDVTRAEESRVRAQATASSFSCPSANNSENENSAEGSKFKKMSCPDCGVAVVGDPCGVVLSCWGCRALVINGHKVSKKDAKSTVQPSQKLPTQEKEEDEPAETGNEKLVELKPNIPQTLGNHALAVAV